MLNALLTQPLPPCLLQPNPVIKLSANISDDIIPDQFYCCLPIFLLNFNAISNQSTNFDSSTI